MKLRRIVTAFASGPDSGTVLAAVAALAAVHDAELEALFVEGDDLARLAALPFARELGFPSAAPRRLDPETVERALRARARQALHSLARETGRTNPRWTARAARGSLVAALLAASPEADLVVVSNRPWDPETLRLVREHGATLLVLPPGATVAGPLVAVCGTKVPAGKAVPVLCALADAVGDGLSIVVAGDEAPAAASLASEADAQLRTLGREAKVYLLHGSELESPGGWLRRQHPGAIALVGAEAALGEPVVSELLASTRVPVFVCPS